MMSRQRAAAILVPALLLVGCPRPMSFGDRGEAHSAEELLKWIDLSEATVSSVRGEASLSVDGPQGKGSTSLFIEAALPASLHLEQLDFFGRPQSVLVSDGERFGFYDGQAARYFRGPATTSNVARFLPVSLPIDELVAILLGRVPRVTADTADFTVDQGRGVYVLSLHHQRLTQVLWVDPSSTRVVRSTVSLDTAYELELGAMSAHGAFTFPERIHLELSRKRIRLDLKWKDLTFNQRPDASLFEASPPEGVPVTEVDGEGRAVGG